METSVFYDWNVGSHLRYVNSLLHYYSNLVWCQSLSFTLHCCGFQYYSMVYRGKKVQTAAVAVGRELIGFIWHSMILIENEIGEISN